MALKSTSQVKSGAKAGESWLVKIRSGHVRRVMLDGDGSRGICHKTKHVVMVKPRGYIRRLTAEDFPVA